MTHAGRPIVLALASAIVACGSKSSPTAPAPAGPPTAALQVTYEQNPAPFQASGCSFSTPSGWFTTARIQETAGVAVTVTALTQKLDGAAASFLNESFNSRFGACGGAAFTAGTIVASGAACGTVGACTTGTYSTYQFSIAGTDANGHAIAFDAPVLQLGARPAAQTAPAFGTWFRPSAEAPVRSIR